AEFTERNIGNYLNIPMSSFAILDGDTGGPDPAGTGASQQNSGTFYEELTEIFGTLIETTGAQNIYIERRVAGQKKAYLFRKDLQVGRRYYTAVLLSESEIRVFENGVPEFSGLLTDEAVGAYI